MRTRERGRPRGPIAAQRRRCLSTHALAASWQRSQPHAQWCRRVELESLQCELRLVRGQCKAAEAKNEALEQRERSRAETEEAEEAEPDASTVAAFFGSHLEEALVRALPSRLCHLPA